VGVEREGRLKKNNKQQTDLSHGHKAHQAK